MSSSGVEELVLVTGMTGAGRSTVAKVLEDLGFFVVDNLPPQLLGDTVELFGQNHVATKLGVVVDARSRQFFSALSGALERLRKEGLRATVIFVEAADEVLVRRQEAARRPHPLRTEGRLLDGFRVEREMLRELRTEADLVIDTTRLNVHQLAARVSAAFDNPDEHPLRATIVSFGFKYGIPVDSDMVADMRFLPNPYWDDSLRPLSGLDPEVSDYVLGQPDALPFLDQYEALLTTLTDGFVRQNKRFLSLAIGCTGGRHRSVAMSEALGERLRAHDVRTLVIHRDLGRE
ncbi:RNase adapter RapZ [Mumia zhuanghuii]|uniref:RNase adapter RapZ n=1 Tax=Mumia zhuanghuii TaxID=2585211 RepID=A0A5C4MD32_9ACTN|nr:RNase adapter RapZ [Mumia zhuanghuii]TNC34220.1 RNase adapter RapZ [Mumia zhuanghuii]TNC40335.1 RNase adapter RapZ [Mumia zhuanghuii]